MAPEKTSNDYRAERKARLAKAAKKNSTKSHKIKVAGGIAGGISGSVVASVVAVILALAIVIATCFSLGVFDRWKKIDDYSAVEYEYYYRYIHNYYYQTAMEYDSYYGDGYGYYYTGYDYSKLPEDQVYPGSDYTLEDGSKPTWKEYFEHSALTSVQQYKIMSELAEKDTSFKLDEEVLDDAMAQIDELKASIKEQAEQNGQIPPSFNTYLREAYGKGMNEKIFTNIVKTQTLVSEYSTYLMEQNAENYTPAELEAEYKKDTTAYDCVDFRIFSITPEKAEYKKDATDSEKKAADEKVKKDAKDKADKMLSEIKDEASFITLAEKYATKDQKDAADYSKSETTLMAHTEKATISSSFDEATIKWLYSKDTKAGEKKVVESSGTYYVFYIVKTAYRDDTTLPVDVRHILVQFDDNAKDKEADKKSAKAEADAIATQIREADDKLATFIQVCTEKSDDTGSAADGGLIQYLTRGKYVKAFEEWSLDKNRKVGDIEVIETEYGYHVMYFEKAYAKPYWQIAISQTLANEALNKQLDDAMASDEYKVDTNNKTLVKLNKKIYEDILDTSYAGVKKAETTTAAK